MYYSLAKDSKGTSLTLIFSDGKTHLVGDEHPNFDRVLEAAQDDDVPEDEVMRLANLIAFVGDRLTRLSERVSVVGNNVLFDGDPLRSEIATHIVRMVRESDERGWMSLVSFLEKVQTNPNEHSRDSLYSWIANRDFTLTQDGDLIAYKGVQVDSEGMSLSISHGTAIVNGVVHNGAIPNPDGAVVEMPRSEVQHNTAVGCSTGLHAGTWGYAAGFARGRVLTVRINPRDVVSVPTDCDAQKMRVSRYEVLSTVEQAYGYTTLADTIDNNSEDYDDGDEGYFTCDECGDEELSSPGYCDDCADYLAEDDEDDFYDEDDADDGDVYNEYGWRF